MQRLPIEVIPAPVQDDTSRAARLSLLTFAWIATLALSNLPNILIQELEVSLPLSLLATKLALLVACFGITFVWKPAQALRRYLLVFLILLLSDALAAWVSTTAMWQNGFGGAAPFTTEMMGTQLLRLGTALLMASSLWLIYRRRRGYFFAFGDLSAPAAPVRWLGIERPVSWRRLGWLSACCITLGTLAFLLLFGTPMTISLMNLMPLLPAVVLFAALNAFSEEMTYRAALLAPLRDAVGSTHALLLTAALFGLWHFYGVPYGAIGVVLAGFLGWYLGKSMVETNGVFWAWFIHFWQDVAIFSFIAFGSMNVGG
jgi:membrane protease YdiL (CAAX protease family)